MFNREVEEVEKGKEVFHSLFNFFDFAVHLPARKAFSFLLSKKCAQIYTTFIPPKGEPPPFHFMPQPSASTASGKCAQVKDHRHSRWLEEAPLKGAKN
jgi:hypothetical protein